MQVLTLLIWLPVGGAASGGLWLLLVVLVTTAALGVCVCVVLFVTCKCQSRDPIHAV